MIFTEGTKKVPKNVFWRYRNERVGMIILINEYDQRDKLVVEDRMKNKAEEERIQREVDNCLRNKSFDEIFRLHMMSESKVEEKVNLLFKLEMKLHKNSLNSAPLKKLHG